MTSRAARRWIGHPARLLTLLAALALAGAGPAPGMAVAAGEGAIDGQLTNATAGGAVPGGVEVVLHVVAEDKLIDRLRTTTDGQGRFWFGGLDTAPSVRYLPAAEYGGALYFPKPVSLGEQPRQGVEITVYEPTDSQRSIAFERSNLLIQGIASDRLEVMEMGAVANVGDRTYVGPQPADGASRSTLRFSVPVGAVGVTPQAGFAPHDLAVEPDGFTMASPIVPGRHSLAFSYSLPFSADRLDLRKRLDYPTLSFSLYVPDVGLEVDSPMLTPQGQADLGGQRYLIYTAQNLPAGTELRIGLGGLPAPNSGPQPIVWSVLGLGCATLGAGLLLVYRRRLAGSPSARHGEGPVEAVEEERMRVLILLARLEDRYEQGELSADEYEREREAGKRKLLAIGRRAAGVEPGAA